MTTRQTLLTDLRSATGEETHAGLLEAMIDRGLASDLCLTIDDVPESDLLSALLKVREEKE